VRPRSIAFPALAARWLDAFVANALTREAIKTDIRRAQAVAEEEAEAANPDLDPEFSIEPSAMRSGRTDFGMAEKPRWRCQRSTICAGVLPCFSARQVTTGCDSGLRAASGSSVK